MRQRFKFSNLRFFSIILFYILFTITCFAQQKASNISIFPADLPQRGGRFITSTGKIHALLVFVQFVEDSYAPNSPHWPPGEKPAYFNSALDSTFGQASQNGSLSHWLRVMSFGKMQMAGDAYLVTTDFSYDWYQKNRKRYGDINKHVLRKLDQEIDFGIYDQWTFGEYQHKKTPDGIVDWIIIIHRNNLPPGMHPGNGVASLGFGGKMPVDNGQRFIKGSFPGSGTSLEKGAQGNATKRYAHEIGHLWFGSGHPIYNKEAHGGYGFWAIMFSNSVLANAHDRHWLGWANLPNIKTADSLDIVIGDFLTTGDAYRIPIPGTRGEAFILENHQEISDFDNVNKDGSGKGLYIYHVKGRKGMPRIDLEAADGRFHWENPYWIPNPWAAPGSNDSIPVFQRGKPARQGFDDKDAIPHSRGKTFKIYVTDNNGDGQWVKDRRVFGDSLDAFRPDRYAIFSPWSNPNSHRWDDSTSSGISVEIIGEHTDSVQGHFYHVRIRMKNSENGPPSNPLLCNVNYNDGQRRKIQLTWMANQEPDIAGYRVFGRIGNLESILLSGEKMITDTTWIYHQENIRGEMSFFIQAIDKQGKKSHFSNGISLKP